MSRKMLLEFRRDTAANWTSVNPTLAAGEPGFETNTGKVKIGDGSTAWNSLSYLGGGSGTISDITSSGGTLTITGATGPTTNIDLPASGVTAGTYGDGSHIPEITLDAQGRVTAVTSVGVSGGSGTIGFEIGYTQITASVNVTATVEASSTTIISPGALTFDGSPVLVTFFCPFVQTSSVTPAFVVVSLFEGSTQITRLINFQNFGGGSDQTVSGGVAMYRFTPSAASHTYTIKAHVNSTTNTPAIGAGAGGTGAYPPAFVRFTKV